MVNPKLPNTNRSIFSTVNEIIEETEALDMAIGKIDFPCPNELSELAASYIKSGKYNNYAPLEGILSLRQEISAKVKENYGHEYNPETEVTITAGTIQAIHTAISSVIKDEDEVIVFEPSFESFVPSIISNGGKPVFIKLLSPNFHIDWEEVRKMITTKTRMIIINYPNNPTGKVLSEEDMIQLQRLTNGTNIIILSDDSFESIIFDNQIHQSIARFEKLISRSLIVSSFGALYNINGWSISYCLGPEKLMSEFRKMQQFQLYNVNHPLQHALADFLSQNYPVDEITEIYQGKRNYFNRLLGNSKYKVIPAQGGYFELIDYSQVSEEPSIVFMERLARDFGVATLPISPFYHEKTKSCLIRVCFAKSNEKLELAADALLRAQSSNI